MSCVRIFLIELHAWEWLGILLARLAVGSLFFLSGRGKLFVPERREQMRQTLIEAHVPFPEINAVFVSTVEFVCGAILTLGALTPIACVMLGGVMIVAIATTAVRNIKATSLLGWLSEFFVSSRGTLSRDSNLAFFLRNPDGSVLITGFCSNPTVHRCGAPSPRRASCGSALLNYAIIQRTPHCAGASRFPDSMRCDLAG
jgi:uncharacterized membrane protein YphA (DoxX/SURF4 family)